MSFTPEEEAGLRILLGITNKTVSDLELAPTLAGDMLMEVESGSGTFSVAIDNLKTYIAPPATKSVKGSAFLSNPISISNNATDPNNDIDFSAGNFQFSDGSGQALATAIMTKRLDATWSAGTGNGGLLNGTAVPKAINSTYHCYKIFNPTTGVEDSAFLLGIAGTAPDPTSVLPSGYTKFDYRGSIETNASGNILGFTQNRNYFSYSVPIECFRDQNQIATIDTPRTVISPRGIVVNANIVFNAQVGSSGSCGVKMYDGNKVLGTISNRDYQLYVSFGITFGASEVNVLTNTSSQVKTNAVLLAGGPTLSVSATINGYQNLNLKF